MMNRLAPCIVVAVAAASVSPAAARPEVRAACAEIVLPSPPSNRPQYRLTVRVHPGLRRVDGTLAVRFAPQSATDRLVFRLWANSPFYARKGSALAVSAVRSAGRALTLSRPNATTLVVHRALAAGEPIAVSMRWNLRLPSGATDRLYGGPVARLGSFFPLLAWDPRAGWRTDRPSAIGWETWTSPTSDFDVRIAAPRGLEVLASGERVASNRWRSTAVRDFAVAVGRFRVVRGTASAPARVALTVGVDRGTLAEARRFLVRARNAMEAHAQRFGPYPWRTFALAAFDLDRFSFEYPAMVFASTTDVDPDRGVAHELGHQWFYSLVGNDQARDPWLDETLATWAQARFSGDVEELARTSIPEQVRARLGEPMTFWDQFEIPVFIAGAYTQGVQALASLGDAEVVDCALGHYVAENAYTTATPDDLLAALESFFPDARRKLEIFGARFSK